MQAGEKRKEAKAALLVIAALLIAAFAAEAAAQPNPADTALVNASSSRIESTSGLAVPAQAGNVSQLIVNNTRVTTHWQGYYGRITGVITLDDSQNNTLFDWQLANPIGEIFASNSSTVSWNNVTCLNMTSNASNGAMTKLNSSIVEGAFNISSTEVDGVNETFNYTFTNSITVGARLIDSSKNCPLVYLYRNDAAQQADFQEVLLTDNQSVIFTSILENDLSGFDSNPWDFQMIVPENQAPGTTDYYFFVELT